VLMPSETCLISNQPMDVNINNMQAKWHEVNNLHVQSVKNMTQHVTGQNLVIKRTSAEDIRNRKRQRKLCRTGSY